MICSNTIQSSTCEDLLEAASKGHVDAVRELVQNNLLLDAPDSRGWTPLAHAAFQCHHMVVELLVRAGASTEIITSAGYTISMIAKCGSPTKYKSIQPLIRSNTLKTYEKYFRLLKLVCNAWSISGISSYAFGGQCIAQIMRPAIVGNLYFTEKMLRNFNSFVEERRFFPAALRDVVSDALREYLENSAAITTRIVERYRQNKPTLIQTGYRSHLAMVVIWGAYTFLADRGGESEQSIRVSKHNIVHDHDLTTYVSNLQRTRRESIAQYTALISRLMPSTHSGMDEQERFLEKHISLPLQSSGTCAWSSLEGALATLFGFWAFTNAKSEKQKGGKIDKTLRLLQKFMRYQKRLYREKYMQFIEQHPHFREADVVAKLR